MRLTKIDIENFKGIGEKQSIKLAPITLLFGPNSAGKSTILQALHYLREILERQNADPDQTIAGGLIDLGGFKTIVHNHDLTNPIRINVELDISEDLGGDCLPNNGNKGLTEDIMTMPIRYFSTSNDEPDENHIIKNIGIGIEVRWSEKLNAPYISRLIIRANNILFAEINSPPDKGRARLDFINYSHPLLEPDHNFMDEEHSSIKNKKIMESEAQPILAAGSVDERDLYGDVNPFESPLGDALFDLSPEYAAQSQEFGEYAAMTQIPLSVETDFGALPNLNKYLHLNLKDIEVTSENDGGGLNQNKRRDVQVLIDELVLDPVRILRNYLSDMTYIGPLREIPIRGFRPKLSPDESRWANGLAAWDLLYNDHRVKLLDQVNEWLSSESHLNTGYRLEKTKFKEIAVPSRFSQILDRGVNEDDLGELQELWENLESASKIVLRDFEKGIVVYPSDVGVGISQLLPVVIGCLSDRDGLLSIEQPELHIHPAIQVGMGDLFIEAVQTDEASISSGKSLLIETHSEHIMLRLLRRVREKSDKELPPSITGLTTDELSVVYVESGIEGVSFRNLRVSDDGDFLDRWPKGFFEERAEELF